MSRVSRPSFIALAFICLLASAAPAPAATPPVAAPPAFEVATIKPIDPTPGVMHQVGVKVYPGGRVVITTFSLKALICTAFNINYWQLSGGDAWTEKQSYDVEAKPAETTPPTSYNLRHSNFTIADQRLRQMLQALLIERFQLKLHPNTATGQVYLLEKNGRSIPLVPSEEAVAKIYGEGFSGDVGFDGKQWTMYNTSMPQFATFLSNIILHIPVLDRTGLDGAFDFRWIVGDAMLDAKGDDSMDPFQTSYPLFVQAAGLRLTKSTGPVETFVIDHAASPSPN
jgi:uncharacterized protein (TIGR03435 family)